MSPRFLIKVAALASTCWMSIGTALAENRIALVIGNSNYTSVTALPNPANDAKLISKFLSSAGFQVVQAPDLTQSEMRKTIGNFATMVSEKGPDTVALVFYAGHGVQVDGENFLIPVDAQIARESDVPLQATRLADIMNVLSGLPIKASITILDACRNNPFSAINKTGGRGLAMVDAPKGSLVAYSTAPGSEALDGDGVNSPFTSALVEIGQKPGLPIEQALKRVRLSVAKATDPKQVPYESSSLTTEFSFFPSGEGRPAVTKASHSTSTAATVNSPSEPRSVESWRNELRSKTPREAYDIVISEDKLEAYEAYLALYPSQSTVPVVRTIVERRKVMVAWYNAVTVNTAASYQAFLAAYAGSDFAGTADRLMQRALSRSIANAAASAFAAAPTCPCNQPTAPVLRQNQKRTDTGPSQNSTSTPSGQGGGSNVAVISNPPTVIVDPTPPVVVVPPVVHVHPRPPKKDDKPTGAGGNDRPTGAGGHDKPKPPTGSTTTTTTGGNTTPILRRTNNQPQLQVKKTATTNLVNRNVTAHTVRSATTVKTSPVSMSSGVGNRAMVVRQPLGGGGGMGGMSMGRMGFRR